MIATILCLVAAVPDADTIRCADGTRFRLAGISALERNGRCNSAPDCPTMRHAQAQPIVARMIQGKTLRCRVVGKSWGRIVGDCSLPSVARLSCAIIASGAAVRWDRWWKQYGLEGCDG